MNLTLDKLASSAISGGGRRRAGLHPASFELASGAIAAVFFLSVPFVSFAQTPDCYQAFTFSHAASPPAGSIPVPGVTFAPDNRQTGCDYFVLSYVSEGFTGVTLTFQSAPGATVAGTFVTYTGSLVGSSVNPSTSTTLSTAVFSGYVAWWRVQLAVVGTGTLRGSVQGYRGGYASASNAPGGSGCVGTTTTPCVVDGPAASGSPPTKPPVYIGGFDGTNTQPIATDTGGRPVVVGGAASGAVPVGNPVPTAGFDGTDVRAVRTDTTGNQGVYQIGLGTFNTNQQAVTGTAAALPTNTSKSVCVAALITNTITVYVGPPGVTTGTGFPLNPGGGACWNVANGNLLSVVASTTGASVAWSVTN